MNDEELRDRLRRADPAASLPPAAPEHVSTLVGETMATTTPTRTPVRWRILLAAAVVAVLAGLSWIAVGGLRPPVTAGGDTQATVRLEVPGIAAKCREPQASTLAASADFAFAGTLASVSGTTATFTVTTLFRGGPATKVEIQVDDRHSEVLLGSGDLTVGADYLIAAAKGSVLPCGYSGSADAPGLRQLFEDAF